MTDAIHYDMRLLLIEMAARTQQRMAHRAEQDAAFYKAVMELRDQGRRKWHVRLLTLVGINRTNDDFLPKFAAYGDLTHTLECCRGLGIDKTHVRAIHALIYA